MPFVGTIALVIASCARIVGADTFLTKTPGKSAHVSKDEVEQTLLAELSSAEKAARVREVEKEFKSMFLALPKTEEGTLAPATVRYALHRYFVRRHGWYMKGIDPSGAAWNSSAAPSIMKDKAPAYIQSIFEKKLHGSGMGLHEVAVFAATLEDLAHQEAISGLAEAFSALKLPLEGPISRKWSDMANKAYFMTYILEGNYPADLAEFKSTEAAIDEIYPGWGDTYMWMMDLRSTVDFWGKGKNPFYSQDSFHEASTFINEVGHRFGSYQNLECHVVKDKLIQMEHDGSGRVRLSQFYKGGLQGDWTFTESVEYLRNLGALDETTNPQKPSVVIPNYLTSMTNCLSSSGFYSICCSDQCEGLMSDIEKSVGSEGAVPSKIADIISHLSSDTVDAPRNLSSALVSRLDEIAAVHGGSVPLHGRLFAQWMHHAYPRECSFPHVSGTISPMSPWEFMEKHGEAALDATKEQMQEHTTRDGEHPVEDGLAVEALPWSSVEELLSERRPRTRVARSGLPFFGILRNVMAVVALASFAVHLFKATKGVIAFDHGSKAESHLV